MFAPLYSVCRSHLMQQAEEQSHKLPVCQDKRFFHVAMRDSKGRRYSCICANISVQQARLFLGLITPLHSHQYSSTDSHHHHYNTHCAFLIEFQSTTIKPLTTSSRPASCFSNTLHSQFSIWQALGGPAPCLLMAPSPSFYMSS